MAGKLIRTLWTILNTDIELSGLMTGGLDSAKAVLELAKALQENASDQRLKPLVENLDSLLDVLNLPLVQVAGAGLSFIPIATKLLTFIVERTRKEPTLADSVQLVAQVAYLESLCKFLEGHSELELEENPPSEKVKKQIKKLGETLEIDGREVTFDDEEAKKTLICFHDSLLAKVFNPILSQRFRESGLTETEAEIVTERISRTTHRYMKEAVCEVRDSAKKLAGIYGDGWLRDLETYRSIDTYLEEAIATKPQETVFDEGFTFQQIYVPLEVKSVKSDGEVKKDDEPCNIETWAKTGLLDETKKQQVLFIQGGPGRGKSVFCRIFADWVRRELHPIYTPILIRLRDIEHFDADFDKTLEIAIGSDFVKSDRGWLTDRNTRFLFLLDGFDELLLQGGATNDLKFFLDQVARFQKQSVESSERGHRVLITGRPLALYGIDRLMPPNLERVEIITMADTIQQQWLDKWQAVVDPDPEKAATETNNFKAFLQDDSCPNQVKDLAREPLLLYLLAAMHRDGKLNVKRFEEEEARFIKVGVYEQALKWVLEKQRSDDGQNLNPKFTGLDPDDLRALLAETGLCVVQSGREYATISAIEHRLEEKEDKGAIAVIENARKSRSEETGLKNALAAFYLKSVSKSKAENSVEFFHKSFGEFLCAERMAETLKEWTEKSGKRGKKYTIDDKKFCEEVYDILGYGALTPEVVEYLMALLERKEGEVDFLALLFERLNDFYLRWSEGEFIESIEDTLPQKIARRFAKQDIDRGQRQVDIYTGLNVMILLFELHCYGQSQEALKERLHFHPCGQPKSGDTQSDDQTFGKTRLLRIIGYSQSLGVSTFRDIVGQFIRGANLSGADLISGADLRGADLRGADLFRADLFRADLSGAHLSGANLFHANLIRANLRGANLSGAHLRGADLIRANLSGANLRGANLRGAHLSGADLSGADLIRADLSGANLIRADLSGADLSDIKWNQTITWSNIIGLQDAREVPESLQQHPQFRAAVVLSQGFSQVREGKVTEAIAAYKEAPKIDPNLEISAYFWRVLCWSGSLYGHAGDVLQAGETAVNLEPDNDRSRMARGLARALTDDFSGAIEDFQAVPDSRIRYYISPEIRDWLEALKSGRNPFTPDVLETLRKNPRKRI